MAEQLKNDWTERAARVIREARQSSSSPGSEQLLRGLARASGVAAEVLRYCGVDLAGLIAATEQYADYAAAFGSQVSEQPAVIERIKREAQAEARALRHNYTGTEHLLLSILSGESSRAREILWKFNVDYALAYQMTLKVLGV